MGGSMGGAPANPVKQSSITVYPCILDYGGRDEAWKTAGNTVEHTNIFGFFFGPFKANMLDFGDFGCIS